MAEQLDCRTTIASSQTMESMPSISVSIQLSIGAIIQAPENNVNRLTSEVWTGQHQNRNVGISRYPGNADQTRFWARRWFVGLMIIVISSEHDNTGIFSHVYHFFCHISHFQRTTILNLCASQNWTVTQYSARWTLVTGVGIRRISFLVERQLGQLFVHPTRLTWPIVQVN